MQDWRRKAKKRYVKVKNKHAVYRARFINTLPPKDRDRLRRHEEQRELGRTAKRITGKLESKSVTKVEWQGQEMTAKQDIERTLLQVNEAKTRASEQTAFLQPPLLQEFGHKANNGNATRVLNGTYQCPPGCARESDTLIRGLRTPHNIRIRPTKFRPRTKITTEDHIKGFKKAKERTSAGMSKLHYGMFKAHIKSRILAEVDASMRSVAYTTGYSYRRWKRGLDVQLLKKAKVYAADKLRTILLLEADFNMNNKVIGADAMRVIRCTGNKARDNYGGVKYLQASEVSMNEQLTYNSMWARRGRA